tara:strand:+ start:331 stop:1203 length:873 start_codon:yes stop_codon:yes gene_type:complete
MTFTPIQSNFYGDVHRWFIGIVIDIQDPLKVGRVRVRIFGVHNEDVNEVPEHTLPWAQVLVPTTEEGVSGLGRSVGIKVGAQVFGMFMDGQQSQIPLVMGSMPRIEQAQLDETRSREPDPVVRSVPHPSGGIPRNTVNTNTVVGSSNSEKAFNFFIGNGFTPIQSAAIVGNLIQESNMDPGVTSGFTGESSFGIAQWNPDANRLQQLEAYALDRGLKIGELETQLAFLLYDFSTISPRFWGYNQFKQMTNLKQATEFFCDKYERPNAAFAHKDQRVEHARQVLETYNNGN